MEKTNWTVDPTHSEVGFKVKHMMFTNVSGKFNDFSVTVENENDDFSTSSIGFTTAIASIDTNNSDRDNHLKSADFFDAETYPTMSFQSKAIEKIDENNFKVIGDLTIRDTTKPVEFALEYSGLMKDPWGNVKSGLSVEGKINRKEFGLTWNAALETGGVLVGEDIKLSAEIQLVKQ